MAGSFNKVLLMGNLTRDIEVKFTNSQLAIAKIGLAVNRKFKLASGELKEEVTFLDLEAFGKTAEVMKQYLTKGSPVFVEGRLKLDQWDDKETGAKRSKVKVVVENFRFIGTKSGAGGGGGAGGGDGYDPALEAGVEGEGSPSPQVRSNRSGAAQAPAPEIQEDDIPF